MSSSLFPLSNANLQRLPSSIAVPRYDRSKVGQAICHIGVGGFHRAHQAVYCDDLLQQGSDLKWGLCGIGLLDHDVRMRDVMQKQDCLYTVLERDEGFESPRIIGAITSFLFAPEDRKRVIDKLAAPETLIVSLTITEGGYFTDQSTGEFDGNHPSIRHDLEHPHEPITAFGFLLESLIKRHQLGLPPFTMLSCDNLQNNGDNFRKVMLGFAELRDPTLAGWLTREAAFPNCMVDRITPATTDEQRALVRDHLGYQDDWPVVPEPFRQWVIEDHFTCGRPAWQDVGVEIVSNVLPYEKMKMRLLNASHQAMCYVGMLVGLTFAHETMMDPQIREFVQRMMDDEVTPVLDPVPGIDLADYKRTLIKRFANPVIADTLARLGTEGSARIPKFVLPTIVEASGTPIRLLTFTVATWIRYLEGTDEQGKALPINDPYASELQERAKRGRDNPRPILEMKGLFPAELMKDQRFVDQLTQTLASLYKKGSRATLQELFTA